MRKISNKITWEFVSNLDISHMDAAEISGNRWSTMPFKSFEALNYPGFDISNTNIENSFDIVIAEQVWENLKHPYKSGLNAYKMLKPNGWLVLTVPFLIRRHDHPIDCTRWTDVGLKGYLEEIGFDEKKFKQGAGETLHVLLQI